MIVDRVALGKQGVMDLVVSIRVCVCLGFQPLLFEPLTSDLDFLHEGRP